MPKNFKKMQDQIEFMRKLQPGSKSIKAVVCILLLTFEEIDKIIVAAEKQWKLFFPQAPKPT